MVFEILAENVKKDESGSNNSDIESWDDFGINVSNIILDMLNILSIYSGIFTVSKLFR